MHTERRASGGRIDVGRPVDILDGAGEEITAGFTRNLCEGGLRARVEELAADPGANLLIRLYLEEDREPVVREARIVWCASDLYGEGAEVGLRMFEEGEEPPPPGPVQRAPAAPAAAGDDILAVGREVRVDSGGLLLTAEVISVDPPGDEGVMLVKMRVAAGTGDGDEPDPEQWKARPFRDAARECRRCAGPVVRAITTAAVFVGGILATVCLRGWRVLPERSRVRITDFIGAIRASRAGRAALGLPRTAAGAARRAFARVRERVAAAKSSRLPARAGD